MLEYCLERNELTDNPDDMRARTVNVISLNQDEIINRILKIGAGLTRSDIVSVLEAEAQVVKDALEDGEAVTTHLFNAFPSIQGVFTGAEDAFDSRRHSVKIHYAAGIGLREASGRVKLKKVLPGQTGAIITAVTDVKTGSVNHLLTPGRTLRIYGGKLKVMGKDASVGVFFIGADGKTVKVEPSDIVENKPTEVIVMIPELEVGEYHLRLATQFAGSGSLAKKVHTADFAEPLTVPSTKE
ncbi:MAG: DUF4469 domain-containing protein [Treponema sp.]|jgi:hypothetical protein|nr:DUF4469 domain-containing protein [Treponema sp.]